MALGGLAPTLPETKRAFGSRPARALGPEDPAAPPTPRDDLYNPGVMLLLHRTRMAAVVVMVAALLASPFLDEVGLCGHGGCPEAFQSSHAAPAGPSGACLAAVLVAAGAAAPAFFASLGGRRPARHQRPPEAHLPPESPPPQFLRALPSH